jgi:hypothetical protein
MSQQLINRSPDLKQLRDEGYDIEVLSTFLLIKNIPYVNSNKEIKLGTLVSELTMAGDVTTTPSTHVALFTGDHPCNKDGTEIKQIKHQSGNQVLGDGLEINHSFSSKPTSGGYKDYYEKMTTYIAIISSQAQSIDPSVTAKIFPVIEPTEGESVFAYFDTASSRAGINLVSKKLEIEKIGIVGLGGTGSYVLDLVAKTPVREIHLFDGDKFLNHNAFRSPGAPLIGDLRNKPQKVAYFKEIYSRMHLNIVAHDCYIDSSNVDQLQGLNFVFLCLDGGEAKRLIVEKLVELDTPFIDVGLGVELDNESLGGILRITTSTVENREHLRSKDRISFSVENGNNDYSKNIQIADLNALNAALAVIKWKKLFGFYRDLEKENFCAYTIDGNSLINDDQL